MCSQDVQNIYQMCNDKIMPYNLKNGILVLYVFVHADLYKFNEYDSIIFILLLK